MEIDEKARIHFPEKTTRGNNIGDFVQPNCTTPGILMVKHSEKAKYYGKALRECGSRVEGDPGPAASKAPLSSELVPFNWHMNDPRLWEELSSAHGISAWVNLTEADASVAEHCVITGRPYLGMCHTTEHKALLNEHLSNRTFCLMQEAGNPLHEPDLVALLEQRKSQTADDDLAPTPSAKAKPKAKSGAAKAKSKSNAKPPSGKDDLMSRLKALDAGGENESDEEDEDDDDE